MGQITRIEIENFKSYGGRQTIGPFQRFTAVVGPNGAGKSNLMDAISFVLGIQSRQLRSTQLKDLLYRMPNEGPGKRKASVTVVYEASVDEIQGIESGEEIKFTRMISASGVGSYRLNGKEVTFEKYESQLREIGVIIQARNFLVFQGDVEAIASKKPEELTKLFEQISGSDECIQKYNELLEAKNIAEENTIFSFQKRKGLAAERKLVKEQKEEAERFQKKMDEKVQLQVEHFLWQLYHINGDMKSRKAQIAELEEKLESISATENEINNLYKAKKKEHAQNVRKLTNIEKSIEMKLQTMEKKEPQIIRLREQIKHSKKHIEDNKVHCSELETKLLNQTTEIEDLENDLADLKQAETVLDTKMKNDLEDDHVILKGALLEEYQKIKQKSTVLNAKLRTELDSIRRQDREDKSQLNSLSQEEKDQTDKLQRLNTQREESMQRKKQMNEMISKTERTLQELRKDLNNYQENQRIHELKKTELEEKLSGISNQLRDYKEGRRQNKYEMRMSEAFNTLKRLFPGVRGRLVDLCKPTERRYNMAVTVATGKHMDAIVVTDHKTGADCIQYLRDQRLGSMQFLPLDRIRAKPLNERYRNLGNNIKVVFDIIECDPEIEPAVLYAVSNTVVCESIEDAKDLCFRRNERVKAVTIDGMVINKNGSMTGGQTSNDLARAGRWEDKEINNLKAQKEELQTQLSELNKEVQNNSQLGIKSSISNCENRLEYANADVANTQAKLPYIESQIAEATTRLQSIVQEKQRFEAAIASRSHKINDMESKVNSIEDELFADFSKKVGVSNIRVYEEQMKKKLDEDVQKKRKIQDQIAKLDAQLSYVRSRDYNLTLSRTKESISRDKEELKKLEKEHKAVAKEMELAQASVVEEKEKLVDERKSLEDGENELKSILKKKSKRLKEKSNVAKEIASEGSLLDRLKDKWAEVLRKATMEQIRLPIVGEEDTEYQENNEVYQEMSLPESEDMEADTQAKHEAAIPERYRLGEIDFESLEENLELQDEKEYADINSQYELRLVNMLAEIERMQPNMKAVEKFDEIQERLRLEEVELDKTKQIAHQTAEEFENVRHMRHERFIKAFNHVSGCIDKLYKDLTRSKKHSIGGTAYLSLEDAEEPYLHGMKYHAMPPMKRFRDMDQLSGGEKTVAALALLFAIHSYHPSPFFVLDEVDAALDNVNVNKVSNYIQNCDFQCIVISLKDTFYEKADALVGICKDITHQCTQTLTLDLTQYGDTP